MTQFVARSIGVRWRRTAGYAVLSAAFLLCVLFLLIVQFKPIVNPAEKPASEYLSKTRTLIRATVPAEPGETGRKTVILDAGDLTAAANFLLLRKQLPGWAECTLEPNRLKLAASIRLPFEPVGLFVNIRLIVDDAEPHAFIKQLKFGRFVVPDPLVGWIVRGITRFEPLFRYSRVGEELVREIRVRDQRLRVSVNWNRNALGRLEGLVTDLGDKERLLVYHDKLAEVVGQPQIRQYVRLGTLTKPLFAEAKKRTETGNDPIAENRALLLVLGAYVNGKDISAWLPEFAAKPDLARRRVLLHRRIDTAEHFMTSAVLAMSGNNTLADMVGLAKEMNDAHDGSGFSFVDLAADEAGSWFGRTTVDSQAAARRAQQILSLSEDETAFLPVIKDLPENLGPADFARNFKGIQSAEFQVMKARITERLLACALYRQP